MTYPGNRRNHTPAALKTAPLLLLLILLLVITAWSGAAAAAAALFMGPRARVAGAGESLTGSRERVRRRDARGDTSTQKTQAPAETAFRISQASEAGADRDAGFP